MRGEGGSAPGPYARYHRARNEEARAYVVRVSSARMCARERERERERERDIAIECVFQ